MCVCVHDGWIILKNWIRIVKEDPNTPEDRIFNFLMLKDLIKLHNSGKG